MVIDVFDRRIRGKILAQPFAVNHDPRATPEPFRIGVDFGRAAVVVDRAVNDFLPAVERSPDGLPQRMLDDEQDVRRGDVVPREHGRLIPA